MSRSILYFALFCTYTLQAMFQTFSAPQGFPQPLEFEAQELFIRIALAYRRSPRCTKEQALEALAAAPKHIKTAQDWLGCIRNTHCPDSLYHTPETYAQACGLTKKKRSNNR